MQSNQDECAPLWLTSIQLKEFTVEGDAGEMS